MWRIYQRDHSLVKPFFFPALIIKIASGIALGLVYTYYYEAGDTFVFFQDSLKLSQLARDDFFAFLNFLWRGNYASSFSDTLVLKEPRALFFTKIISVSNLFSGDSYWIDGIYLSMFSFWGSYTLVRRLTRVFPEYGLVAVFSFMLLPSLIFWTSGVIKESLAVGALFYLCGLVVRGWSGCRMRVVDWIMIPIMLVVLWKLKYFYLGAFIPVVATSVITQFLTKRLGIQKFFVQILIWLILFIIPFALVMQLHPNFYPSKMLEVIVYNNEQFNKLSRPDNLIVFHELNPTWQSMLMNAPWAFASCVFRPFVWEADSAFKLVVAIENLVLLLGFITGISKLYKVCHTPYRLLIFGMCVYILLLAILLALSTPNFGTLARYRVGCMPFLFLLVLAENKWFLWSMAKLGKWWQGFVSN